MKRFLGALLVASLFLTPVFGKYTAEQLFNELETLYPREARETVFYVRVGLFDIPGSIAYVEYLGHTPADNKPIYMLGFDKTVANTQSEGRVRAILAHELGHMVLEHYNLARLIPELGPFYELTTEAEADEFAISLVGWPAYEELLKWFSVRFKRSTQLAARYRLARIKNDG
jgi:Zn-dependent protease with chaperone function